MSYKISESVLTSEGAVTSLTVPPPENHQAGDLFLIIFSQMTGTASTLSVSGSPTSLGSQATQNAQKTHVFHFFAASSSEADIVCSSTVSATMSVVILCIRDADPTTPIDAYLRQDSGVTSAPQFGSLSTTTDNCLVIYACGYSSSGISSSGAVIPSNVNDLTFISKTRFAGTQLVGYKNQPTAGATLQPIFWGERASNGGSMWTIAIKDAGSGNMSPDIEQVATNVLKGGLITSINEYTGWTALDSLTATSIAGIPISSFSPTIVTNHPDTLSNYTYMTGFSHATSGIDATGILVGSVFTPSVALDFTDKLMSINFATNGTGSTTMGQQGYVIIFEDGSGNWAAFNLSKQVGYTVTNAVMVLDPENWTPLDSSGTMDWSDVAMVGFAYHRVTTATTTRVHAIKSFALIDKFIGTGGNATTPLTPAFLKTGITGWELDNLANLHGSAQMLARIPIQIGDGSTPTYFSAQASSFEFPLAFSNDINRRFWKVGEQRSDLIVYASAADIINFRNCVIATSTKQNFTIHASSSTSAAYDFRGSAIVGWVITSRSGIVINNASLANNYMITLNGGGLESCTVRASLDPIAVTTTDPETIANTTFISAGTGHAIEATATGTYDFVGNTFSGYGADNTTDAAFYNNSGGAITLNIPADDTPPTVRNGTGASTTIVTPTDNQSVTISGAVAGSRIEIYDLTSNTQLYNGTPTFPYTWTDGSAYVADREIRLRVAYVNGTSAKEFIEVNIGTSTDTVPALAYLVNQVDDAVYNANAVDGSAVTNITIDDGTMLLSISSATETWQNMYAYEMYWLFTSTGIEDLGQSITAPDTANYLMDENVLKIKNISGNATVITGGWGRSVNTGEPLDIIDLTGDPLFASPPHVVAYAVGSGVTPGDVTDIADAVWDEVLSGHTTSGTAGKEVTDTKKLAKFIRNTSV